MVESRFMIICTFNLRCVWDGDGVNAFVNRAGLILEKIAAAKPDVIGFQEGTVQILAFLERHLPDYVIVFNQRDANFGGEGLAIAIRKETAGLVGLDFFWLSETPDVPGSRFAEQSWCPRVTQGAICRRKSDGKLFRVYNTHLDHESDSARILGVRCLMGRMAADLAKHDFPFFLLGDFNATPESETIRFCDTCDLVPMVELTRSVGGTFHDFGRREPIKIDYIYAGAKTAVLPYTAERWEERLGGVFLSDHYPVCVTVGF